MRQGRYGEFGVFVPVKCDIPSLSWAHTERKDEIKSQLFYTPPIQVCGSCGGKKLVSSLVGLFQVSWLRRRWNLRLVLRSDETPSILIFTLTLL